MTPAELTVIVADLSRVADQANAAIAALRAVYGVVTFPAAHVSLVQDGTDADGKDTRKQVRENAGYPKPKAKRVEPNSLHAKVLDVLREAGEPMKPAAIVTAAKSPDWHVRLALKELAADGKVVAAGATHDRTYALAKRGKAPAALTTPVTSPVTAPAKMSYAGDVIDAHLAEQSLSRRDLLVACRRRFPAVEMRDVELHLQQRIKEGVIEERSSLTGDVYLFAAVTR